MTYAPLAMFLVNLYLKDKKYFYLIPLYALMVILYNFYLAYMLLAFIIIYALIKGHITNTYSVFGKNTFIINKKFYSYFCSFFGLIIIGVAMGAFILIPSIYYMLSETSRVSTGLLSDINIFSEKYFLYSLQHYFNTFINSFTTHEPHNFMLVPGGAYAQEHVSFYMTSTGLLFFLSFFFLKGKTD